MNEYKITYSTREGDRWHIVIERNEAAARKAFKVDRKGAEINAVELVDTNVTATKAQEREALEKIKAMIEELGPQSYLKTAFEGVFEDAEENIEFDAAFSMKQRYESSEEKLREMSGNYVAAKRSASVLEEQLGKAQEQIEALQAERDELKKRLLPKWLYEAAWTLASGEADAARARMEETAETMAYYAEAPQDIAFKDAVEKYRKAKQQRETCEQIARGLDDLTPQE